MSQRDLLQVTAPIGDPAAPPEALRAAQHLGRYTIERELARGGMGIVYLAYDPELQRRVALKVLTASDDEGRVRLLREARAMARLAHPNVVTVYDVVTIGERDFVAMELMEGGTLADWLTARPRAQRDILAAFAAAGNGLAAAHVAGLVHRDFKPANVLRTRGGRFAVTDFGLARDHEAELPPAPPRSEVMAVPAMPRGSLATITATGGVLGTPPYMAPEQWAGGEVSPATDQFAFCVSLWEALAGKRPFAGASDTVLREAIERGPAQADASSIPPALRGILSRGLDPDPARRWPDVAALLAAIERATATAEHRAAPTPRRRWVIAGTAVVATAVGVAVVELATRGRGGTAAEPPHVLRAAPLTHEADLQLDPAISPDGTRLAYASGQLGHMQLFVRPLAGGQATALATNLPGDHRWPQWSRDGSQIVFQSTDGDYNSTYQIDIVASAGGPARSFLAPAGKSVAMPVWSPDGRELAYIQSDQHWKPPWELVIARADGSAPRSVVSIDRNESLSTPSWSPDGTHLAFSRGNVAFYLRGNIAPASIWVVAADGGAPVQVTSGSSLDHAPIWTPDGRALLFVSDRDGSRDIYQLAIDDDGRPAGKPARLTVGLNAHVIALVGDRRLVSSVFTYRTNLWSVDIPTGETEATLAGARPITTGNQIIEAVDASPDGRWLAFDSNLQGNQDIYVMPAAGGQPVAITTDPANDFAPAWSPDGKRIAFHSFRTGSRNVFTTDRDGKQVAQVTTESTNNWSPRWSPDGRTIAYFSDRGGDLDVFTIPTIGGTPHQLTSQRGSWPAWSPDGRTIAFNDPHGLWTIPAGGGTPVQLVVADHVSNQVWSRDGKTIYFREQEPSGLDALWAVDPVAAVATGRAPRRVLRLDDPTRHPDRVEFAVDDHRFLLPLTEHDANLWQLELDRAPTR